MTCCPWNHQQANLIQRPPPPTWCRPFDVTPAHSQIQLPDEAATTSLRAGIPLLPPRAAPTVFITTHPSPLMDGIVHHLLQAHILRPYSGIVNTFRLFAVSKPDSSACPILDLYPWTPYYCMPPRRLYRAAEVLHALLPLDDILSHLSLLHNIKLLSL
jgi:hypothetical protein